MFFIHLFLDGIADEAVQAFTLTGGEVLDDLPLSLLDDQIDSVVGFLIVSGGCFLLRVGIFSHFPTPLCKIYTSVIICNVQ